MDRAPDWVIDALPGAVWTADARGGNTFTNRFLRTFVGEAVADWRDALHPDDRPGFLGWAAQRATIDDGAACDARLCRGDGAFRRFRFRAQAIRGVDDAVTGWCGMGVEIDVSSAAPSQLRPVDSDHAAVLDSIPYSLALMAPTGEVQHINRHLSDFTGLGLEAVQDWETSQIVHPDDFPNVEAAWRRAVETRTPHEIELRIRGADGVYRWFQNRGLPLFDDGGRIVRWYSMHIDIDDRRQAEARLAAEIQLLEMAAGGKPLDEILDSICRLVEDAIGGCHCSVLVLDPSGRIIERGAAPTLAASFLEAEMGCSIAVAGGADALAMRMQAPVTVPELASDRRFSATAWGKAALAQGVRAWWSTPILSGEGKVLGAFGLAYRTPGEPRADHQALLRQFHHLASLTIQRARSDASLRQSEAFLTEGQRLSQTGSFLWRTDTDELTFSAELYRIFQFDTGEPVTLAQIGARVHADDRALLAEKIDSARRLEDQLDYQIRLQMPDGSFKHLQTVAHASVGKDGRPQVLGALQDITQRRVSEGALDQVRSELARVTRATSLGALTASIAHEVNQPLSGIVTNAGACLKMLAADPPNVSGAQETARRTVRDANRAADIIRRLRALFARQDGRQDLVDLNAAAGEVVALIASELQRSRTTVRMDLAERLPRVMGDRIQLQQVILNLLVNAVEAMRDVGDRPREIWITTCRGPQDQVQLAVRDCGNGIDPEGADRLFEAFYTTKAEGMGIGLSVSHSIVENHGGRLEPQAHDGPGATFVVTLPRSRPESASKQERRREPAPLRSKETLREAG